MYAVSATWDAGETAHPSREQIADLVRSIDGHSTTIVTIHGPEVAHLAVGGGPDRFIVYATRDNWEFKTLIASDHPQDRSLRPLIAGGQSGDYEVRKTVAREEALKAALRFASDGALEPSLMWESDN